MKFYAIDVETANADYSSICQIGLAEYENGVFTRKWSTLVNPEAYFDSINIMIHGITEKDVMGAPTFPEVYNEIFNWINDNITVHHMPFDKIAISRACMEYDLNIVQPLWLDSAKIVRRTWEDFAYRGYGLANIAQFLNINFKHHDALEDAMAAAQIVDHACNLTGLTLEEWLERIYQPLFLYKDGSSTVKLDGNPEGAFFGENLVFTGFFIPHQERSSSYCS